MGRTNHYACQKKTDCTISADAANTNNLLLFNGTDAKEGVSQSDFNGRIIMLPETNGCDYRLELRNARFSVNDRDGHREAVNA
jgi:hypothetical protein